MSDVHIIRSPSGADSDWLALCGATWDHGICISSLRVVEATCEECRELAGVDVHIIRTESSDETLCGKTAVSEAVCLDSKDLSEVTCKECLKDQGLESPRPNIQRRYRYTITITGHELLSGKEREYLESKIEAATGFEVNVHPEPEEIEEEVDDE